jgi:hypothetical protein
MINLYWGPLPDPSPGKRRKRAWVSYKGNRCLRCGYDRCIQALVFHHIDPALKRFSLSSGTDSALDSSKGIIGATTEEIYEELDKSVLLCANCHAELHAGLWSIQDLVQGGVTNR